MFIENPKKENIMMKISGKIDMYPDLAQWFHEHSTKPTCNDGLSEFVTWNICDALSKPDEDALDIWVNSLDMFCKNSSNAKSSFLELEVFLIEHGLNISLFASDMAIIAIDQRAGEPYQKLLMTLADLTELDSIRFLSAWMALNLNKLDLCISECDRIDDPNHSVYTLSGQAYLDMGMVTEAIEDLKVAVKLCPNEILSWFQLAKSYLIHDKFEESWKAANECYRIAPHSEEVQLLMGMISVRDAKDPKKIEAAWEALAPSLKNHQENEAIIINLLEQSFYTRNKKWAKYVIENSKWNRLKENKEFMQHLGTILRNLGDLNWMDLSAELLTSLRIEATG